MKNVILDAKAEVCLEIPARLQTEIVEYLWKDVQNLPKSIELKNDSPKNDVIAASMARGVRIGMNRAIEILNNWNKPLKGKVVAQLNSDPKKIEKITKEYELLTTKKTKCSTCEGTGFSDVYQGPERGYKCEQCNGEGHV